ncbi:MAG: PTS sugar transporter subunit IIC [Smithellaceae bacterium]
MFTTILLISVFGGLMCLDRVFIQLMISRPIVIAPVIGIALGAPYAGLLIGAMLELFWIDRVPIGIYVPPNDSIAAVVAVSIAAQAGRTPGGVTPELIALAVLLAIPCALLARIMDIRIIASNDRLSDHALDDAKNGDMRAIERKNYMGLAKVFLFYVLFLFVFQWLLVPLVSWGFPILPDALRTVLGMTFYFLPLLGIAVAVHTIKLRGAIPVFCVIFLLVAVALEVFHVF